MTALVSRGTAEAASFRYAIQRLSRRLRNQARYGLSPSQSSVLTTLDRHGRLRLGELTRLEQIGKSSMTRLVAKLEDAGYVDRRVDPDDGRGFLVSLTDRGIEVLRAASDRQDVYLLRQLDALEPAERQILRAAIPVMERLLEVRA